MSLLLAPARLIAASALINNESIRLSPKRSSVCETSSSASALAVRLTHATARLRVRLSRSAPIPLVASAPAPAYVLSAPARRPVPGALPLPRVFEVVVFEEEDKEEDKEEYEEENEGKDEDEHGRESEDESVVGKDTRLPDEVVTG